MASVFQFRAEVDNPLLAYIDATDLPRDAKPERWPIVFSVTFGIPPIIGFVVAACSAIHRPLR